MRRFVVGSSDYISQMANSCSVHVLDAVRPGEKHTFLLPSGIDQSMSILSFAKLRRFLFQFSRFFSGPTQSFSPQAPVHSGMIYFTDAESDTLYESNVAISVQNLMYSFVKGIPII